MMKDLTNDEMIAVTGRFGLTVNEAIQLASNNNKSGGYLRWHTFHQSTKLVAMSQNQEVDTDVRRFTEKSVSFRLVNDDNQLAILSAEIEYNNVLKFYVSNGYHTFEAAIHDVLKLDYYIVKFMFSVLEILQNGRFDYCWEYLKIGPSLDGYEKGLFAYEHPSYPLIAQCDEHPQEDCSCVIASICNHIHNTEYELFDTEREVSIIEAIEASK